MTIVYHSYLFHNVHATRPSFLLQRKSSLQDICLLKFRANVQAIVDFLFPAIPFNQNILLCFALRRVYSIYPFDYLRPRALGFVLYRR